MSLEAKFASTGLLAIVPSALGATFPAYVEPPAPFVAVGPVAIVRVQGPLIYDPCSGPFDSYSAIKCRAVAALDSDASCLLLHLGSPGGEVSGAFDAARAIKAYAAMVGKPVFAYTDSQACSAAYALACAASKVILSESATLGSIGVIQASVDTTKQDAMLGMQFNVIASGDRKADGNPHVPLSDDARAAMQASVMASAAVFFALVKEARGVDAEAMQAACFVGEAAVANGLADGTGTIEQVVSTLARAFTAPAGAMSAESPKGSTAQGAQESSSMAFPEKDDKDKDAVRSALKAAAEDKKDAKAAAKAAKALAAYDDDKDAASDEPEKKDDDKKDEDAKAAADAAAAASAPGALGAVQQLAATVQAQAAEISALKLSQLAQVQASAAVERATFLATRPDLTAETLKALEALPFAQVKAIVAALPVPAGFKAPPQAHGIQGAHIGNMSAFADVKFDASDPIAVKMGLVDNERVTTFDGSVMRLGVMQPKGASK